MFLVDMPAWPRLQLVRDRWPSLIRHVPMKAAFSLASRMPWLHGKASQLGCCCIPIDFLFGVFFLFFGISGKAQQNDLYNGTKATLELILLGVVKFDLCHHLGMVLG